MDSNRVHNFPELYNNIHSCFCSLGLVSTRFKDLDYLYSNKHPSRLSVLSRVMGMFFKVKGFPPDKCTFRVLRAKDILGFQTINHDSDINPYSIPKLPRMLDINQVMPERPKPNSVGSVGSVESVANKTEVLMLDAFNGNGWLFCAALSPIWFDRVREKRGWVDYAHKNVQFANDNCEEAFHSLYGYEMDEQSARIKEMRILKGSMCTWSELYHNFRFNGIVSLTDIQLRKFDTNYDDVVFWI